MIPCKSCGGSGETFNMLNDEFKQCNECLGSGFLHESADPDYERRCVNEEQY